MYSCIALLLSACSADDEEVTPLTTEPVMMRVGAKVVTSTEAEKQGLQLSPPCFTFWDASTFLEQNGATNQLYYSITAPDSVPAYTASNGTDQVDEATWFDTGHPYPDNDQTVLVSGFSPASIGSAEDSYNELKFTPEMLVCDTAWIAREALTGSSYNPFSRALRFVHATTRVTFYATTAQGMTRPVLLKEFNIPPSEVLYRMKWTTYTDGSQLEDCRYLPAPYDVTKDYNSLTDDEKTALQERLRYRYMKDGKASLYTLPTYLQVLGGEDPLCLGTYYLRPERSEVRINVSAYMINGSERIPYTVTNMPVPFVETDQSSSITLNAGDSYEVTLRFNNVEIELEGRKLPFDDGGNVYIAIQPFL
jgi:hypothetical protein